MNETSATALLRHPERDGKGRRGTAFPPAKVSPPLSPFPQVRSQPGSVSPALHSHSFPAKPSLEERREAATIASLHFPTSRKVITVPRRSHSQLRWWHNSALHFTLNIESNFLFPFIWENMCTVVASGQKGRFLQNACPAGVSKTTIFFLTTTRSHFPPIRREKEKSEINEVGSRISRLRGGEKGGEKCD